MSQFSFLSEYPGFFLFVLILSALPAVLWFRFLQKIHKTSIEKALITFLWGVLAVVPITILKYLFEPQPNFDLLIIKGNIQVLDFFKLASESFSDASMALFVGFIFVGIIEEYLKHYVVKKVDYEDRSFRSIADSIAYAGFAALGFAFIENMSYAFSAAQEFGALRHWDDGALFGFLATSEGWIVIGIILFRSLLSTCAHIFFSAIYGYHYGIHKFAKETMIERMGQWYRFGFTNFLHKTLRLPVQKIFAGEVLLEGLFLAMLAHALYNFFLSTGYSVPAVLFVFVGSLGVLYELQKRMNVMNFRLIEEEVALAQKLHEIQDERKNIGYVLENRSQD